MEVGGLGGVEGTRQQMSFGAMTLECLRTRQAGAERRRGGVSQGRELSGLSRP